jgi:hypothetical protein
VWGAVGGPAVGVDLGLRGATSQAEFTPCPIAFDDDHLNIVDVKEAVWASLIYVVS